MKKALLRSFICSLALTLSSLAFADVNAAFDKIDLPSAKDVVMQPLYDNNEAWVAKWEMIKAAKETIYADFFIIGNDIYGKAFLGLLLKKAEEGVQVKLMTDAFASYQKVLGIDVDYFHEIAANKNIEIRFYNRLGRRVLSGSFGLFTNAVASNHDKFLVIDGKYCLTGGRNIDFNYYADVRDLPAAWRDSDVYVESEVLAKEFVERAFLPEFNLARNKKIRKDFINFSSKRDDLLASVDAMDQWLNSDFVEMRADATERYNTKLAKYATEVMEYKSLAGYEKKFNVFEPNFRGDLKILDKTSHLNRKDQRNEITPSILEMIDAAEVEIIIQNPYVILSKDVIEALARAQARGVEVVLHTNSPVSSNHLQTQALFIDQWDIYKEKLNGARVFAYVGQQMLHAKVFVFDRKVAMIGSYNLDNLSENINSEIVAMIKSEELAKKVASEIEKDLDISLELTADERIREGSPYTMANVEKQKEIRKVLKYKKLIGKFI